MEFLKSLFGAAFVDGTPDERARAFRLIFRACVITFMCWSLGFGYSVNMPGFARADDVSDVAEKAAVKAAVARIEPIAVKVDAVIANQVATDKKVNELDSKMEEVLRIMKDQRRDELTRKMRDLNFYKCMTSNRVIAGRFAAEIADAQAEYTELQGFGYPLEPCRR